MTASEFDPNIPVGEPDAVETAERFGLSQNPPTAGGFSPDVPVGEPGGFKPLGYPEPAEYSGLASAPLPTNSFDPDVLVGKPLGHRGFGPEPAGPAIRCAARLIDAVVCMIIAFVVAAAMGAGSDDPSGLGAGLVGWFLFGLVSYVYFVVLETALGFTPGKRVLKLSVRGPKGAPKPTFVQSAVRNSFLLLLLVPYAGLILVLIPCIRYGIGIQNSVSRQGFHDVRAGGTEVMKDA